MVLAPPPRIEMFIAVCIRGGGVGGGGGGGGGACLACLPLDHWYVPNFSGFLQLHKRSRDQIESCIIKAEFDV